MSYHQLLSAYQKLPNSGELSVLFGELFTGSTNLILGVPFHVTEAICNIVLSEANGKLSVITHYV